jgi:hypothetical protein
VLHLVLRRPPDPFADLRAAVARTTLRDYEGPTGGPCLKVGGRDISALRGQVGYSDNGVCSYVYRVRRRGDLESRPLALKVMLNMQGHQQSTLINEQFNAERELLSDPRRLPPHAHVMTVLHSFTDDAGGMPGWNFEADIVSPRTMVVVRRGLGRIVPLHHRSSTSYRICEESRHLCF